MTILGMVKPKHDYQNRYHYFITSPVLVPSSCVRQHTQDVPAQRVLPSNEYISKKLISFQGGLQRQIEVISKEKTIQLLNATVESPVMEFLPPIVKDFSLISSNNEGFEDTLEASYIKVVQNRL